MTTLWPNSGLLSLLPFFLVFVIWFTPVYFALARLRRQPLGDTAKAVWAAIILLVPIFGAAAYWVVGNKRPY